MKFYIQQISPCFYLLCPVISGTVKDGINLLFYRLRFTDSNKEPGDIMAVDFVIFPDDRPADIVQVQRTHDIQAGTTAGRFCHMGFFPAGIQP